MARSSAASAVPRPADVSSAEYRLIGANGAVLESGRGDVTVAGGVLELTGAGRAALRVPSGQIASVAEPEPFVVLVALADGSSLELSRLGRMRTQLLAELHDARAEVAAAESGALGDPARFTGAVAASPVDLHVFDDAVLILAGGHAKRIAFSFVADVRARDYTVTVDVTGQDALAITRLGRRTDEFVALLSERLRAASNRTAAFLGSLLPGLDPLAQRAAAGLLRDGVAVPAQRPRRDPSRAQRHLAPARDAARPVRGGSEPRRPGGPGNRLQAGGIGPPGGGRRHPVARSVGYAAHRPARQPGRSVRPRTRRRAGGGRHVRAWARWPLSGGYGGPFGGGPGGYGEVGGYWAFRALGAALNRYPGGQPPMTPRADVRYGLLIPETEDLAALTTSGADPTVLAFALLTPACGGDPVAYEALNRPEPVTYVYRAGGPDPRALVNQALDDAGFAAAQVHAAAAGDLTAAHRQDAAATPLASGLVATVPHDPTWVGRRTSLFGC